jgi:hypothetical protein
MYYQKIQTPYVQQKDRFNKKSFPFKKPFKAAPAKPAVKVQPAFTAFVGRQLAPLNIR